MPIILKHILRNIRKNYFSGLLIIISLVLSTAIIYMNLNINSDMMAISQEMFTRIFGGYDINVTAHENEKLDTSDDTFADKNALFVTYDIGEYSDVEDTQVVCISSDWEYAEKRNIAKISEGMAPKNGGEVGITAKKAAYYDLHIGDTITAEIEDEIREYKICAIYDSVGMFVKENHDCIEMISYLDISEGAESVFLDADKDSVGIARQMQEDHPEWYVEALGDRLGSDSQLKSIRQILLMMLMLTMIMSYYVISSVTTLLLDSRMPVIGTFRSIGASNMQMNLLLLAENAIYGVIGGAFGILIGEGLRYIVTIFYFSANGAEHAFNPLFMILGICFAVFLQVGITLVTLLRAGNYSIKEIIFRTSAVAMQISKNTGFIGAGLLLSGAIVHLANNTYNFYLNIISLALVIVGSALVIPILLKFISRGCSELARRFKKGTLYLAYKNLGASKISISSVILSTMVISLSLVILMCTTSIDGFFDSYKNNYPYDIFVKSVGHMGEEYIFLTELDGVEHIVTEYWDYGETKLNGEETDICFVRRGGYSNGITFISCTEDDLADGHIIIDEMLAAKYGLKIGNIVSLSARNSDETFFGIIDGMCDSGIFNSKRSSIILTKKDYYKYVERCPALVGVYMTEGADIDELISDISITIFGITGENAAVHSKETYVSDEFEESVAALSVVSVVPILAAILAVLGLVNNQIISYNRKRREYAVLYSVAMNRNQIGRMVFEEMAIIFLTGTVFGLLLSMWLVRIVRDIIYGLIFYVDIQFDILKILLILLGTFAILCISAIIPRAMVAKMNVVEEIKYD